MDNVIITVIGAFVSTLLLVNAFFIKSLVSEMSGMRVDLAIVITQHDHTIGDVKDNKARILMLEQERLKFRERLHSLESGQSQVLQYISDN